MLFSFHLFVHISFSIPYISICPTCEAGIEKAQDDSEVDPLVVVRSPVALKSLLGRTAKRRRTELGVSFGHRKKEKAKRFLAEETKKTPKRSKKSAVLERQVEIWGFCFSWSAFVGVLDIVLNLVALVDSKPKALYHGTLRVRSLPSPNKLLELRKKQLLDLPSVGFFRIPAGQPHGCFPFHR